MVEVDPEGRFLRSAEVVGRGKFKQVYKGFDQVLGIDVAWSKFDVMQLSDEELHAVLSDIQVNLTLEHPNTIRSFKCWEDQEGRVINLITELFTSGNLRQYRNHYKQLDLKAVKRMARQILRGLEYLHARDPPITHGDLRCDKIYVNGNSGEIKIGDIGLATLLPYRSEPSSGSLGEPPAAITQAPPANGTTAAAAATPASAPPPLCAPSSDIFAFGLCLLELLTLKQLDPQHCSAWPQLLETVQDDEARNFISLCLTDPRPTASELLQQPWLQMLRKVTTTGEGAGGVPAATPDPSHTLDGVLGMSSRPGQEAGGEMGDSGTGSGPIAVGKLRGEDYLFEFAGKVRGVGWSVAGVGYGTWWGLSGQAQGQLRGPPV